VDKIDCAVIGAGVVGLAVARALALAGREVIILESENAIGTGTSSRNSEVIHAGIYYPQGSLKAAFCVAGKAMLYDFCASHGVPHRRAGKLIVATREAEIDNLHALKAKAAANGVALDFLEGHQAKALEPNLNAVAALFSPTTGLIDSHALMLAYLGDAEANGAALALNAAVTGGAIRDDGILLEVGGPDPMTLLCDTVVNSAGLFAQKVAASIKGVPAEHIPPTRYAKGTYFTLAGRSPFTHLVYPCPEEGGLGVHLTLDLAGQARFGPDVEWVDEIDYRVDPRRGDKFYAAIRTYWPALADNALSPGYTGIRPKLGGPGTPGANPDFTISGPAEHGIEGLINLFAIESPGLTASLAIAEAVLAKVSASKVGPRIG
jgi:L-2-hydroxyglutarate oxidase LhgO